MHTICANKNISKGSKLLIEKKKKKKKKKKEKKKKKKKEKGKEVNSLSFIK